MQIKPVFTGDGVANGIAGMGMQDHLGIADSTGGEIDQAGVVTARLRSREFGRCLANDLMVIRPAFASVASALASSARMAYLMVGQSRAPGRIWQRPRGR